MLQQDSAKQSTTTYTLDELTQKAKEETAKLSSKESKKKGLEFMAIRFNVIDKRRQLQREKAITPAESCLLQEIELGTIGARNKKKNMGSQAEFYLEDLSNNLGYKSVNKIWTLLKSLEKKQLIIRKPTRSKGLELIGLNPAVFGQILIDKEHQKEKKRHLRLVDNSEPVVDKVETPTHEACKPTHEVCAVHTRIESEAPTNRVLTEYETPPLDSFRPNLDSLKGEPENGAKTGESFTLLGGSRDAEREAKKEAHRKRVMEQVERVNAGVLVL